MSNYDYIVQEPWLFEDYIMPDIERDMIIRLVNQKSGDLFPFRSAHELLINTIKYYKEQKIDFYIQLQALPSLIRTRFISLLAHALGLRDEKTVIVIQHDNRWFTIMFEEVIDEYDARVSDLAFITDTTMEKEPAFILEFLGHKKLDNGVIEYITVLYDRIVQKHGIVRFRDYEDVETTEQLLAAAYVRAINDAVIYSEESELFDEEEEEEAE